MVSIISPMKKKDKCQKIKDQYLRESIISSLLVKYENSTKVECDNVVLFDQSIDTNYCKPIK